MTADRGQDLREILYGTGDFFQIVREERNYAAILYSALLSPKNSDAFLQQVFAGQKARAPSMVLPVADPDRYGCFFEYAHLRDAWHATSNRPKVPVVGDANIQKFKALLRAIQIIGGLTIKDTNGDNVAELNTAAAELSAYLEALYPAPPYKSHGPNFANFNQCFTSNPSEKHVQSPQTWQAGWIMRSAKQGEEPRPLEALSSAARKLLVILGWCFNAKPDLVIHLNGRSAICVEIKIDSAEGVYRVIGAGGASFRLKQTEIQQVIMNLLGFTDTIYVSIVQKKENKVGGGNSVQILWSQLFSPDGETNEKCLDLTGAEPFVFRMMNGLHARRAKNALGLRGQQQVGANQGV